MILNRPYRSVAELGYVFRDQPFKTLDFWSDKSADAGLLDLFSVRDEPTVVAGRVNPSNAPALVLQAIIAGTLQNTPATPVITITSAEAATAATAIASHLSTNVPLSNPGSLVDLGGPVFTALAANKAFSNKAYGEGALRSLSSVTNTRTWNLMIDVIAQAGVFPPGASNLNGSFVVQGERRYWLHVAIDRFTGKVVDQQLESVYE